MSMDARCQAFHEAASGTGKSKGAAKEVATLRKFLHKNQDHRFTDKAVSRLFDTIQLYRNSPDLPTDVKEGLLEDALKMPFTVFGTKQKQKMMKWLEDSRGGGMTPQGSAAAASVASRVLAVIDLDDDRVTLMDETTGDTFENVDIPSPEIREVMQKAFLGSEESILVVAQVSTDDEGHATVLKLASDN